MKTSGSSVPFLGLIAVTLSMTMPRTPPVVMPDMGLPPPGPPKGPPLMPFFKPSPEPSSKQPVVQPRTPALVSPKECECDMCGVFDVKVVVRETPAGCGVRIDTVVQTPTILTLSPNRTLAVTRVPMAIAVTVTPTALVRATTTVSKATFSACPSQHTMTETGSDPSHETVIVCKTASKMPGAPPCTGRTPIPTTTVTQTACVSGG